MRVLRHALGLAQPSEAPALVTLVAQPRRSAASAREFLQEKKDLTWLSSRIKILWFILPP
jgi:hypothetical protein